MTMVDIKLRDRNYTVFLERRAALDVSQFENVVTDENVFGIYGETLLKGRKDVFQIPVGEVSKSVEWWDKVTTRFAGANEITAFGGGVVTDLAGFAASTMRKGIPLHNIPTSLVGMVDAAIGGKNGINNGEVKNDRGTFYQPEVVLVDPNLLVTLPVKEFRNGIAEIIKYGAIGDGYVLNHCSSQLTLDSPNLEEIILACIKTKGHLVEKDERDEGPRRALNFGHTIGHALELYLGLSHGQAIAIGMAYEAELAERGKIYDNRHKTEIQKALKKNRLPYRLPAEANRDRIIKLMRKDKKGPLTFAFNEHNHSVKISEKEVRKVLR